MYSIVTHKNNIIEIYDISIFHPILLLALKRFRCGRYVLSRQAISCGC